MPATLGLTIVIGLSALLHLRAEYAGARRQVYLFKPLTTSLIIALALWGLAGWPSTYGGLIVVGLLFSLAGDIFLMLPQDRFVAGLAGFLVAHLLYIAAFVVDAGFHLAPLVLAGYLLLGGVMLALLWPHLGAMRLPVLFYMAAILIMGWQAAGRGLLLDSRAAYAAALGAFLFVISDALLALDRFRRPFVAARALVLGAYFAGQWLIALSVQG